MPQNRYSPGGKFSKKPLAPMLALDFVPAETTHDRSLYCPPCYGERPHYRDGSGYRCRVCGRYRLAPEQYREMENEHTL